MMRARRVMGGRRRIAAVVAAALVGAGVGAGVAEGAVPTTYTQYLCRLPSGAPAPVDGLKVTTVGPASATDSCLSGGGFVASVPGISSEQTYVDLVYAPPPYTQIVHLETTRSTSGLRGSSDITYSLLGTPDLCDPSSGCQDLAGTFVYNSVLSRVDYQLTCPDPGCHGDSGAAGTLRVDALRVDLQDQTPPTLTTPPAGGLFNTSAPVSGTAPIAFSAADKGGGVYQAAVVVDGVEKLRQVVDANNGDCREPFVKRTPCKLSLDASLGFDTTQLPDGPHKVALVVYDATNVNSVTYGPVDITVDNRPRTTTGIGSAHIANGAPASAQARIVPAKPFRRKRIRMRFGKPRRVQGRLLDEGGNPVVGARLAVFLTGRTPGSRPRLIAGPLTDAQGRYAFRLPKHGTNGRVLVAYRTFSDDPGFATSWSADVDVPAPITLKPSRRRLRNGETLALIARVRGPRLKPRSGDIAFQVLIGTQWRTFGVRPLDRQGRATIGHKFRVTFQRLRYRFRALVLPRRTFPYRRAKSRTVRVQVN